MALSRLAFMPPELKIMTYYEFDPLDLLSVSHVSKFWRSLALEDKRWDAWFDKVAHPKGEAAEHLLARYKLAGSISKRAIVTLCFYTKCAMCPEHTWDIFLPLLKRLCRKCLDLPEHAVISFSSALATYDLKERDIGDALVVHWEETDPEVKKKLGILYRAKLMSESVVKQIAIKKYGGEANMTTHLEAKKPPSESHTKSVC
ncbi:hypothetical protein C8J57DRAFT_1393524 [Mycena rebaudengoi]|nr:hypothetical protein C8J57DRAFT_1393524 [Mycena rebaudengoi]